MTPIAQVPGSVPFSQFAGKNSMNVNYQTPKASRLAKKKNKNMQDMIMGSHSYLNRKPGGQTEMGGYTSAPNTGKKAPRSSSNLANMKQGNLPVHHVTDN